MSKSRIWFSAFCALFLAGMQVSAVFAENIVIVEGKRYEQVGDKLYPQIDATWTDLQGVEHPKWMTDYSSYIAPVTKPMNLAPNKAQQGRGNLKVAIGGSPDERRQSSEESDPRSLISTRDLGCKHYLTIGADMLFDFDKATLTNKAEKVLFVLGPMLEKYAKNPIVIEGHTDAIGTDEYNQNLSEQRAQTVRDWLAAHGFVTQSASIKGYGKSCPIAANTYNDGTDFPQGRAKNRRVEIYANTCQSE